MATKTKKQAITITITGKRNAKTIDTAFDTKAKVKEAETAYATAKELADPLVRSQVIKHWMKDGRPEFGAYEFHLPDGVVRTVHVQNRYSTKSFSPKDAKEAIQELVTMGVAPKDVFDVVTTTGINSKVLQIPAVKERIFGVLNEMEASLKKEGLLPKDTAIIETTKKCVLQEHAVPKIVGECDTEEQVTKALETVNSPVTISMIK
jgi:hypothetical protein